MDVMCDVGAAERKDATREAGAGASSAWSPLPRCQTLSLGYRDVMQGNCGGGL